MKIMNERGNVAAIAIAAIVALAVGFGVGYGVHKSSYTNTSSNGGSGTITASAENLDNTLVTLGVQHMTLTDQAVADTLDNNKDATAATDALVANGNTIGSAIGSVYGSSAAQTFDKVWKLHLVQFVAYAVADSKGDSAGKQAALNTIQTQYTIPLAQFLAKANPNLPESTVQTLLSQHVAMTAQIIDDHVQGNFTKEQSDLNSADQMMTKIFSTIAGAIAKQYPSKFAS